MTKSLIKSYAMYIMTAILGLAFMGSECVAWSLSHENWQTQIPYLTKSVLADQWLIMLFAISAIISIFSILSKSAGSDGYVNSFKAALIPVVVVGLIFGISKSAAIITSNKYLQFEMYYLIFYIVSSILNRYLLTALSTLIFVFITLPLVRAFLHFIGVNRKVSEVITCGIIPSLLIFAVVGYRLNKAYLPGFFDPESVIGNAVLALASLLLGLAIGLILYRMGRPKFTFFPKVGVVKILVGILSFVILLNVAHSILYLSWVKTDRPSLILISIDTLRSDHLGCYGYDRNTTPNIDIFAQDSLLFANTIVQSSWTLPSHMSLLTSLYPSSHGVTAPTNRLNDEHLTLAELLQNAGYETAAFTDGAYLSREFGYQGFDRFDDTGKGIESIYTKAVAWLKKNHNRPFFLFLHTYQVHAPFDPPSHYDIFSSKSYRGIVRVSGNGNDYYRGIKSQMTLEDYAYVIDKYDGEIYYTDHFLGKLFEVFKSSGIYDKDVIILTSDHGENFLDHPNNDIDHKELYEEIVKVPFLIRAPKFPKGRTIDIQVESIDIMPTVLHLLGIPVDSRVDGESLVDLVKTGTNRSPFAFSERSNLHKMIRDNDWKLIHRSETELELFDLKNDPDEQDNLMAEKREMARSLYERLDAWADIQRKKSKLLTADKIELDGDLTQKLKALGYLN